MNKGDRLKLCNDLDRLLSAMLNAAYFFKLSDEAEAIFMLQQRVLIGRFDL